MRILYNGQIINKYICFIFLTIQIIEYVLFGISSMFKPIDELISILALLFTILIIVNNKAIFLKKEIYILVLLLFIVFVGLFGNIVFKYQPLNIINTDILLVCKFIFGYLFSRILFITEDLDKFKKPILKFCKLVVYITFICLIINIFVKQIFPVSDKRFFMYSQRLFFSQPTYLSSFGVVLISMFVGFSDKHTYKKNLFYIGICLSLIASTLRFKALSFSCVCIFLLIYWLKEKQINKRIIFVVAIISVLLAYQQISFYYINNEDFARKLLTVVSIKIANTHFPLGSGFGTFASYISGKHYSPLYHKYGLDIINGMTPQKPSFVSDTFWPMIIGQFGWLGLLFFIGILICFYTIIKKLKNNYYYSSFILLVYMLITSTAESSFVQPYAVCFFFIIGMYVSQEFCKKQEVLI